MTQRGGPSHFDLTADERAEAVAAAYERLFETRRYLSSVRPSGHADCCDVARARAAALAEQHRGLEKREEALVSLLSKLEPTR